MHIHKSINPTLKIMEYSKITKLIIKLTKITIHLIFSNSTLYLIFYFPQYPYTSFLFPPAPLLPPHFLKYKTSPPFHPTPPRVFLFSLSRKKPPHLSLVNTFYHIFFYDVQKKKYEKRKLSFLKTTKSRPSASTAALPTDFNSLHYFLYLSLFKRI